MIRKLIKRFVSWALAVDECENARLPEPYPSKYSNNQLVRENHNGINFTIYNAHGGKVILTSEYDDKRNQHKNEMYIINTEDSIGAELDLILTKHMLSR